MTSRKSKLENNQEGKSDSSVRVAIISTVGVVATTLITALFAPAILKSLDKTPTPLPTAIFTATSLESNVFAEDFLNGSQYWDTTPIENARRKTSTLVSNGVFRWTVTGLEDGYISAVSTTSAYSDFNLELTLELVDVSPKTEYFRYGVMFRDSEKGAYYFFMNLIGEYKFSMYTSQNDSWTDFIDFTKSSFINTNDANTFRVECRGNKIRLYLNGNFVADWSDDTHSGGKIDVFAVVDKEMTTTLDMTSFKLTLLSH